MSEVPLSAVSSSDAVSVLKFLCPTRVCSFYHESKPPIVNAFLFGGRFGRQCATTGWDRHAAAPCGTNSTETLSFTSKRAARVWGTQAPLSRFLPAPIFIQRKIFPFISRHRILLYKSFAITSEKRLGSKIRCQRMKVKLVFPDDSSLLLLYYSLA